MSCLMHGAEERGVEEVRLIPGGDASVIPGEGCGEGMDGAIEAATGEVIPEAFHYHLAERFLLAFVELLMENRIVHPLRLLGNRLDQRDELSFEIVEDELDLGGFHTGLELIEQG